MTLAEPPLRRKMRGLMGQDSGLRMSEREFVQWVEAYALSRGGKYRQIRVRDGKIASAILPGFFLKESWLFGPAHTTAMGALKEMRIVP